MASWGAKPGRYRSTLIGWVLSLLLRFADVLATVLGEVVAAVFGSNAAKARSRRRRRGPSARRHCAPGPRPGKPWSRPTSPGGAKGVELSRQVGHVQPLSRFTPVLTNCTSRRALRTGTSTLKSRRRSLLLQGAADILRVGLVGAQALGRLTHLFDVDAGRRRRNQGGAKPSRVGCVESLDIRDGQISASGPHLVVARHGAAIPTTARTG